MPFSRFRLRTLMIAVAVVGVGLAVLQSPAILLVMGFADGLLIAFSTRKRDRFRRDDDLEPLPCDSP